MINSNEILETMKKTALDCGKLILSAGADLLGTKTKSGRRDLVTDYDVRVQALAVEKLLSVYAQAEFFCEETKNNGSLSGELVFIIDPIDGTANFVHEFHHSCISIGCMHFGTPIAGVVFDPYKNEMFYACKDGGAFLNGRKITAGENALADSFVMFGTSPYNAKLRDVTLNMLTKVYTRCLDIRRSGSAALDLCYVASGKAGLYFEGEVSLWDYAAGVLILYEAGGRAYDFSGKEIAFGPEKTSMIAGKQAVIDETNFL